MGASAVGNTEWSVPAVGGRFWSQDVRGARRKWCQVLRREQCHYIWLPWVSAHHMLLFHLHLNQNIHQGLLEEIRVWLRIHTWFLITLIFWSYCNRTDLSLPRMTQHSRSYNHLPWTHFPSPGKSVSQVPEFLHSKVPFSQMTGTQTGFGLRRCWKGLGKGAGCLGEVNPSSLRAIWGGKIKVGPYRRRPQEPRPAHLGWTESYVR